MAIFLLNYIYFYFIFFTLFGSDDVIVHDDDGVSFIVFEYEIKVIVIKVKYNFLKVIYLIYLFFFLNFFLLII